MTSVVEAVDAVASCCLGEVERAADVGFPPVVRMRLELHPTLERQLGAVEPAFVDGRLNFRSKVQLRFDRRKQGVPVLRRTSQPAGTIGSCCRGA